MKIEHEFRFEIFISLLFVVLGVLAIKYIGFIGLKETIFTITILLEIPVAYIGCKYVRKIIYSLIRGYNSYENK